MTAPAFESTTARLSLPLLFAGQAQKEGTVNEALARIDALLHGAVEDQLAAPPANVVDGQAWLVGTGATGAWAGQDGQIAAMEAGNWLFFAPRDGMKLLNRASGLELRYAGGWKSSARPAAPSGGTTIDTAARTAIVAILNVLANAGLVPAS